MDSQTKTPHTQAGFVIIEVILVVILLAAMSTAGYFVYKAHTSKTSQPSLMTKSLGTSTIVKAAPALTPMLVIKELDVELPLPDATIGLVYQYRYDDGVKADSAQLGTSSTIASCGYGYLGEILKVPGNVPPDVRPYNTVDQDGATLYFLLKQFNGFYVQYVPAQNNCQLPDGTFFPDRATHLAVVKAVNQLQLLP